MIENTKSVLKKVSFKKKLKKYEKIIKNMQKVN